MTALPIGKGEVRRTTSRRTNRVAILAFGSMLQPALGAAEELDATVANMRFVKPLDVDLVSQLATEHDELVTIEENVVAGGAGSAVAEALAAQGISDPAAATRVARRVRRPRRSRATPREVRARRARRRRVRQRAVRGAPDRSAREAGGVGAFAAWRRRVPSRSSASPVPRARPISPTGSMRGASPGSSSRSTRARRCPSIRARSPGSRLMGGPMSVNDGLALECAARARCCARPSTAKFPVHRSLPRRAAARAGAGGAGHARAGRRDRLARRRRLRRSAQREWFGGRAGVQRRFNGTTTRSRCPSGATPVLTNAFNAQPGVRGRGTAHRLPVPHRDDAKRSSKRGSRPERTSSPRSRRPPRRAPPTSAATSAARVAALHAVADDVYARWAHGLAR